MENAVMILGYVSIFLLILFTLVRPMVRFSCFAYILFGVSIILFGCTMSDLTIDLRIVSYCMGGVITLFGILLTIAAFSATKEQQEELGKSMRKMGIKTGLRRIGRK